MFGSIFDSNEKQLKKIWPSSRSKFFEEDIKIKQGRDSGEYKEVERRVV